MLASRLLACVSIRAVYSQCFVTRSVVNREHPTRIRSISPSPSPHPTYQSNRAGVSIRALYSQCFIACSVVNRAWPTGTCSISHPPPHPTIYPHPIPTSYQSNRAGVSIRALYSQCFVARSVVNKARPTRTCSISPLPFTPPSPDLTKVTEQVCPSGCQLPMLCHS